MAATLVDHELEAGGEAALARVYEKTFGELAPIIGALGVRGIFARATELVRAECPALSTFVVHDEPREAAVGLTTSLSGVPRDVARETSVTLYGEFFGLIVAFVGVELTLRLLRTAWPGVDLKETL